MLGTFGTFLVTQPLVLASLLGLAGAVNMAAQKSEKNKEAVDLIKRSIGKAIPGGLKPKNMVVCHFLTITRQ